MNAESIKPFGKALLAYHKGDINTQLSICRDDGQTATIPVSIFFRDSSSFSPIDKKALENCTGHVLDIGAGSGIHSLFLHEMGFRVTAIDISPEAVEIMRQRGLKDVHCTDIFSFQGGPFDTLLMMGHGIGMVETVKGLNQFLKHAQQLVTKGGQILLDSTDVRKTDDPANLAYHKANQKVGCYIGEIRLQFQFQGQKGPLCGWLHVDTVTLQKHAQLGGWQCEILHQEASGDYLARLQN